MYVLSVDGISEEALRYCKGNSKQALKETMRRTGQEEGDYSSILKKRWCKGYSKLHRLFRVMGRVQDLRGSS